MTQINIDKLTVTSLRISAVCAGVEYSSGTGFVVRTTSGPLLISNYHVIAGRDPDTGAPIGQQGQVSENIRVLHNVKSTLGSWKWMDESIFDPSGADRWIQHPRLGRSFDVVALPLENTEGIDLHEMPVANTNESITVAPAELVTIVGFPLSYPIGAGLAVWKTGMVASEPDFDFEGLPRFLVDSRTKGGMSGAPVLARRAGPYSGEGGSLVFSSGPSTRFLGVYSGRMREDLDLGIVWKRKALLELISQYGDPVI